MGVRTPMQKAPPKSLRMTQGQGSRSWFIVAAGVSRARLGGAVSRLSMGGEGRCGDGACRVVAR